MKAHSYPIVGHVRQFFKLIFHACLLLPAAGESDCPRDPLRSTGPAPHTNLHKKSAPEANSKAISRGSLMYDLLTDRKSSILGVLKGPPGPFKGPRGPFRGPRGPFKGTRGPFKGPRGPLKGSRGPLKGPRGPFKGHRGAFEGPHGSC